MRYAVDPVELSRLAMRWEQVGDSVAAAVRQLPEATTLYEPGRSGVLDGPVSALIDALHSCLVDAATAAGDAGAALDAAAARYSAADVLRVGPAVEPCLPARADDLVGPAVGAPTWPAGSAG